MHRFRACRAAKSCLECRFPCSISLAAFCQCFLLTTTPLYVISFSYLNSWVPKPVKSHFCLQSSHYACQLKLILHSYGISESSLEVLIENVASFRDSVQKHVHGHETEGFAVHLESVRPDASQVKHFWRPLKPARNILSTPAPRVSCERKRCSLLVRIHPAVILDLPLYRFLKTLSI